MGKLVRVTVTDRLDRTFVMLAPDGQSIRSWMLEKFIPSSSIILFINGQIADDQIYTVHRDDTIRIDMVRAYQLPEYCNMLGIWENDANKENACAH